MTALHPARPPAAPPSSAPAGRRVAAYSVAIAALVLAIVLSLAIGARVIPLDQVVASLFGRGDENVVGIVGTLRVDRTITGVICGTALGAAGVLMQAVTRNPIADPGMLGVNAGAAFGVVAGLTAFSALGAAATIGFALLGAGLASAVIFAISMSRAVAGSPVRLTLAGIAFSAVLSGASQALVLSHEDVLDVFRFWRVGSLTARPAEEALPLIALVALGAVLAIALARPVNLLALGDDSATALGARPGAIRIGALIAVALLCGTATALAGPISFIGLIVPHLLRRLVGPDLRMVLPLSLLASPALLLAADTIGRVIGRGAEVQVGVVTALVGGSLLITIVARRRAGGLS